MSVKSTAIVNAPAGPIQGYVTETVQRYTGIPYAEAKRFQRPTPKSAWTSTFSATEPCPVCPQPPDRVAHYFVDKTQIHGSAVQDEKCQSLSITAPLDCSPDGSAAPKRVMVYFHGGAFVNGSADSPVYNPSRLVAENDVIVVNVGSRLGIFGFLGDETLNSVTERPCNLGLLDCLEALRWVKRNIASFGGDACAKSITIFGQSAGGTTVSDLMLTPEATSLFGRVIIQSAPFGMAKQRSIMNQAIFSVVQDISVDMPAQKVIEHNEKVLLAAREFGLGGGMPFAPQYGFDPLPPESEVLPRLRAVAKDVDVFLGATSDEATLFMDLIPLIGPLSRIPIIGRSFSGIFSYIASRKIYFDAQRTWYDAYVEAGGTISEYEIVWKKHNEQARLGATHGVEIPLLFADEKTLSGGSLLRGRDWSITQADGLQLRRLWAAFAKGGRVTEDDSIEDVVIIRRSSS